MKKNVEKKNPLFNRIFTNHSKSQCEIIDLQSEIKSWDLKSNEIQANFDFTIPNYIIDEIIDQQSSSNKDNLFALINCAVINGSISMENAQKIKDTIN